MMRECSHHDREEDPARRQTDGPHRGRVLRRRRTTTKRSEAVEDEQRDDDDASDDDAEKTDDARGDATRDVFAKNDRHARLRGGEQALGRDGLQARARRRKRVARTVVRCASDSGWGGCF